MPRSQNPQGSPRLRGAHTNSLVLTDFVAGRKKWPADDADLTADQRVFLYSNDKKVSE